MLEENESTFGEVFLNEFEDKSGEISEEMKEILEELERNKDSEDNLRENVDYLNFHRCVFCISLAIFLIGIISISQNMKA